MGTTKDGGPSRGIAIERLMVAPVPADPLRRSVIVASDNDYRFGTFRLLPKIQLGSI